MATVIKKTFSYLEASEEQREQYLEEVKDIPVENLVYIDESGIEMNICQDRGWGKKGEKIIGKKSGKHYNRTILIQKHFMKIGLGFE